MKIKYNHDVLRLSELKICTLYCQKIGNKIEVDGEDSTDQR